jgi:hypothetical protein
MTLAVVTRNVNDFKGVANSPEGRVHKIMMLPMIGRENTLLQAAFP